MVATKKLRKIKGVISKIIYSQNDFTVGIIYDPVSNMETKFVGKINVAKDDRVILEGYDHTDKKYGKRFNVETFSHDFDLDEDGLIKYLADNKTLTGVGPAKAQKIVAACNKHGGFAAVVEGDLNNFIKISKLKDEIATQFRLEWIEKKQYSAIATKLLGWGLSHSNVDKLIDKYGNNVLNILKENPYRLIGEVAGFAFKKCDAIALKTGVSKESPDRIKACLKYLVSENEDFGHCFLYREDLIYKANKYLIMDCLNSQEIISNHLDFLVRDKQLVEVSYKDSTLVANKEIYDKELFLYNCFTDNLSDNPHVSEFPEKLWSEAPFASLNEDQRKALELFCRYNQVFITGSAGCGKSFWINALAKLCDILKLRYSLLAPTGKAAKRIEEITGRDASTIHRYLGYNGKQFKNNPINDDIVIIDECFDARQKILTEHGWEDISKLVNTTYTGNVYSFNKTTSKIELKPVIGWFKKLHEGKILKIDASKNNSDGGSRIIKCTDNHKILTKEGYIPAKLLNIGDKILTYSKSLTPFQRSVLIGCLLGDAALTKIKPNCLRVSIGHSKKQEDYVKFKYRIFEKLAGDIIDTKTKLKGKEYEGLLFHIKALEEFKDIYSQIIRRGKVWSPTNKFLEWIDDISLAYWIMDDGSVESDTLKDGSKSYYLTLCTECFNEQDHNNIKNALYNKYGVNAKIQKYKQDKYFRTRFSVQDSKILLDIIRPYVPSCMAYKVPGACFEYIEEEPKEYNESTIINIEEADLTADTKFVYDITVKDNHNYIAGNIIVSNCSMVDNNLLHALYTRIDLSNTGVVLVADAKQLPPVGAGNISKDLTNNDILPKSILGKCMRQAGELKYNCNKLLDGEISPTSKENVGNSSRKPWYKINNFSKADDIRDYLCKIYAGSLEEKIGFNIVKDVQLITPTNKGELGTIELNKVLQKIIQQKKYNTHIITTQKFYVYDKVIQTRNNYDLNVMNGEIGYVSSIKNNSCIFVQFGDNVIEYKDSNVFDLELAYALTGHRMQGSEVPCVIVICSKMHSWMHSRSWLYTACTRAKQTAIIIGDTWGINNCLSRVETDTRRTFLEIFYGCETSKG